MTIKEKLDAALARQQSILDASKASGQDCLTDAEQREFDTLTAQINALKDVDNTADANAERARASEINDICRSFNVDPGEYIANGDSVDTVRAAILEGLKNKNTGVNASITQDETDKFRAAAADALLLKAGVQVANPAPGAKELRGYSLKDLARESLLKEGRNASYDPEEILRAFTPESSFPAILDTAINKSIVEAYKLVPTTFDKWTSKGSLPDFKESKDHEYGLGSFSEMKRVPENGELENDEVGQYQLPTRKIDTYGKSFSMTRQAFINDDIDFISKLPSLYVKSAKKTIEKQVYTLLYSNSTIYDGVALFHNNHKNLIGSGAAPSQSTIQAAITKGRKQTDPNGEAIIWEPGYLVVPVGYEFELTTIFRSAQVTGSPNNDINPLYNYPIEIVQVPMLNALATTNAVPWFVVAKQDSCRGIQIDYLNGNEMPTVRRMEKPGVLGFHWDIWHDWGVNVRDFRGLVKNPGTTIS